MLSTVLTEFIRSVPIALSLMDRNETERNERIKPKWTTELPKHLNGPTYTVEGYGRAGQGGVWQDRRKVEVGWGECRVG